MTTTREPRIFHADSPEPENIAFLRTDDDEIVQRHANGRYSITGGGEGLDWNDVTEYAPLREIVTHKPLDHLRNLAEGYLIDHGHDTSDIYPAHKFRADDQDVLDALIASAHIEIIVTWPTATA